MTGSTREIIALDNLDRAKALIAQADITQLKEIISQAEALRSYVAQAKKGLELQNQCAEIKIRAERRAGEMLANIERNSGGRPSKNSSKLDEFNYTRILKENQIPFSTASRWQIEAEVAENEFEKWVSEIKSEGRELTSVGLRRLALQLRPRQNVTKAPDWPVTKYRTIIIDPPWPIEKILRDERLQQYNLDYPTMTIDEIKSLPIPELAFEDGCHIYLWTTHRFLPTSFEVFREWGVHYECLLTWVKNVGITPFSWMYSTEHCLFGRVGELPLLKMGRRVDFQAKVREHSRKPDEFYELVREVSPEPRIDVFSREKREGFEQ